MKFSMIARKNIEREKERGKRKPDVNKKTKHICIMCDAKGKQDISIYNEKRKMKAKRRLAENN